MTIDDLVRTGLRDAATEARFDDARWSPVPATEGSPHPGPQPIRRWAVAALAAAIVIAAVGVPLALLAPLGGGGERPGAAGTAEPDQSPGPDGRYADVDDGISITIPEGWIFHQDASGPIEPEMLFAVGSWGFPTGGDCAPTSAQEELPADGALLWLMEYRSSRDPEDFPPRPERFELDEEAFAAYECSLVPSYLVLWTEAGRFFQVHVAFGPEAPPVVRQDALGALDSIDVTAPIPDACPADTGPWSDPACPLPAWTEAVVEEAGYEVTGDTGSALVAEGLGGEFHVWAFPLDFDVEEVVASENYRKAWEIGGVQVYSDGVRMFWVAKGLVVWVAGWEIGEPPPGEPPPGPIVADLVQASKRVDYDSIDTR